MANHIDQIENNYFEWLYRYGCKNKIHEGLSYKKLFMLMHDITFDFYMHSDLDRANDGTDLRYRFASSVRVDNISDILNEPCTVLEMILALAIRCEETIMDDPRYGDRTTQWFWNMLTNLGLKYMTDNNFNKEEATTKIYNFLERRYNPNGKGGLFYIPDCAEDLTQEDIWTQLCWYLRNFA